MVVAWFDRILQGLAFILLVPVLRDLVVLGQCFLSSLQKLLLLHGSALKRVRDLLRRKVPVLLRLFLGIILAFLC